MERDKPSYNLMRSLLHLYLGMHSLSLDHVHYSTVRKHAESIIQRR